MEARKCQIDAQEVEDPVEVDEADEISGIINPCEKVMDAEFMFDDDNEVRNEVQNESNGDSEDDLGDDLEDGDWEDETK